MPSDNIVKYINNLQSQSNFLCKGNVMSLGKNTSRPATIFQLDCPPLSSLAKDTDDILLSIRKQTLEEYNTIKMSKKMNDSDKAEHEKETINKAYNSFVHLAMRDILDSQGDLREPIKSALNKSLKLDSKSAEWSKVKFDILRGYLDFLFRSYDNYELPYSMIHDMHIKNERDISVRSANERGGLSIRYGISAEEVYGSNVKTYCEQANDRESLEKIARACQECKQCYGTNSVEYKLFNNMFTCVNQWLLSPEERIGQLRILVNNSENKTTLNNAKNHPIAGKIVKGIILFLTGIGIFHAIQEWRHVDRLRKSAQHAKSIEDKFVKPASKSSGLGKK